MWSEPVVQIIIAMVGLSSAHVISTRMMMTQVLKQGAAREIRLIEAVGDRNAEHAEIVRAQERLAGVLDNHFNDARREQQEIIRVLSAQAEVMRLLADKLLVKGS